MRAPRWRRPVRSGSRSSTRRSCCVAWPKSLNLASAMTAPAHLFAGNDGLAIGRGALRQLPTSLLTHAPDHAGTIPQEAGYASGEGVYRSFCEWLPGQAGVDKAEELVAAMVSQVVPAF